MTNASFTAAQVARAASAHSETRISRQAVAKALKNVPASAVRFELGTQETKTWTLAALPEPLRQRLTQAARKLNYRNADAMLEAMFVSRSHAWLSLVPLNEVAEDELNKAAKLRDVFAPVVCSHSLPAADRDALIVQRFGDSFGKIITADHARKMFCRIVARDGGAHDFNRLEIYLPDNPRRKETPAWTAEASNLADLLPALESRIAGISAPANPPRAVVRSVWHTAFEEYARLVADGSPQERAARSVRDFLQARAPFLPRNRDTLLKAWNEKLPRFLTRGGMPGALLDLRCNNGSVAIIPEADIARLRWSATTKHSGRLDEAWREEFDKLSESTQAHGERLGRCPRVVINAVNRVLLDGLAARRRGKRYLEKMLGTILRSLENVPAMYAWVMDDMTCNLEVFVTGKDRNTSLRLIQLIGVLDVRSRRFVGWSASLDEAPCAELVCEAFLDAVRRTGKIPHHLFLENGWVFGRAGNVVGKHDETGDVVVAGLAEYGCEVHHFDPQNPTSKGELEKAFDLLQRRMEQHPGYTGRAQRYDAPEQFRREQIEMRRKANPRDPATCRYDFPQGVRVLGKIITDYNSTPQHGALQGLSPDQAFLSLQDADNPPIWLPQKLHWMLAYKYRVPIAHSGVRFTHLGQLIRVRGGNLASADRIGREYWAVVDSRAADCVTFMSLDFSDVFTEPLRPVVAYDQSEHAPDSQALEMENRTKGEHRRLVEDQYQALLQRFGDPCSELLRAAQDETRRNLELDAGIGLNARMPLIDSNVREAGETGERQRTELRKRMKSARSRHDSSATADARPGIDEARASIFGGQPKEQEP